MLTDFQRVQVERKKYIELEKLVTNLLDDVALRHGEIQRSADFKCPYMKALAFAVDWEHPRSLDVE